MSRPNDEQFADAKPGAFNYKPLLYPGAFTRLAIEPATRRELDSFRQPVLTPEAMYQSGGSITALDLSDVALQERTEANIPAHRKGDKYPDNVGGVFRQLWEMPSELDVHIKAGSRLYVGGAAVVEAIETASGEPKVVWRTEIKGRPHRMLAADGKLFIVTAEGTILAFGAPQAGEVVRHEPSVPSPSPEDSWTGKATAILEASGVRDGYVLVLGIDDGRLTEELARRSDLHVIALDADPAKVAAVRERLHEAGLYGTRVSVLVGDPLTYPFPPYLASLVVSETPDAWDGPQNSLFLIISSPCYLQAIGRLGPFVQEMR